MTKRKADSLLGGIRVLSPAELEGKPKEPYFISHLLAPERNHDCYFLLGEKLGSFLCRVGAVKQMLLAHSGYFRSILHEDKKNEPEAIPACDLTPQTVQNLLRYIYGYDITSSLSFDESNRLLYAADKFVMDSLRDNLAVHLSSMLSYENICSLLDNPVCSQQLSLRSSINKILQYETEKVLANPLFLNINVDAFVRILEQDSLKVPEIELWRAALKWATKRAGTNDGRALRTELATPLKHIRLCSLSPMDLCREVIPTGVLTDPEVRLVTTSVGLGEKQNGLMLICNETRSRMNPERLDVSDSLDAIFPGFTPKSRTKVMSLGIITKDCGLELQPFEFTAKQRPNPYVLTESDTYECSCTIQITNELNDSTTYVGFSQQIKYGESFTVPIQCKGENVILKPNNEYMVKMNFTQPIWYYSSCYSAVFCNEHFEVRFKKQKEGWYQSPIKKISYRCVDA